MENGLTLLATIGATAPFVGLFGTVWGIHHALVAIGPFRQAALEKVAGPVGEALIMTAAGLAVALARGLCLQRIYGRETAPREAAPSALSSWTEYAVDRRPGSLCA